MPDSRAEPAGLSRRNDSRDRAFFLCKIRALTATFLAVMIAVSELSCCTHARNFIFSPRITANRCCRALAGGANELCTAFPPRWIHLFGVRCRCLLTHLLAVIPRIAVKSKFQNDLPLTALEPISASITAINQNGGSSPTGRSGISGHRHSVPNRRSKHFRLISSDGRTHTRFPSLC